MLRDVLLVAAGGAIGSGLRYSISVWASQRFSQGFPWHTFIVNMSGAFLLGLLISVGVEHRGWGPWQLFVGIGVLGGYTTFSALSWETFRLLEDGLVGAAVANMAGSLLVGLLAAGLGVALGRALWV